MTKLEELKAAYDAANAAYDAAEVAWDDSYVVYEAADKAAYVAYDAYYGELKKQKETSSD